MTAWKFLIDLHAVCHFMSRENRTRSDAAPGSLRMEASRSELKRWLMQGAVVINGEKVDWDEEMDFPIHSVVLFPSGRRVTMW